MASVDEVLSHRARAAVAIALLIIIFETSKMSSLVKAAVAIALLSIFGVDTCSAYGLADLRLQISGLIYYSESVGRPTPCETDFYRSLPDVLSTLMGGFPTRHVDIRPYNLRLVSSSMTLSNLALTCILMALDIVSILGGFVALMFAIKDISRFATQFVIIVNQSTSYEDKENQPYAEGTMIDLSVTAIFI